MTEDGLVFNPPPGWPRPPAGWRPPKGWVPDPSWPAPPPGWDLWVPQGGTAPDDTVGQKGDSCPPPRPQRLNSAPSTPTGGDGGSRVLLLEAEVRALRRELESRSGDVEVVVLDDERVLQEVGIYRYHHPLENADAYKERLSELSTRIAEVVKTGGAIEMSNLFTFDNSLSKGRKMCRDLGRLMLRAYNAEADNSLRTLRAGNVVTAKKRLEASRNAIARLGSMMEMRISDIFHALRLEEVELTADYLMKKQEEREAAREERARLREEKRVAAELAAERERLDKERDHLLNALAVLQARGETDPDLEKRLAVVDGAIEQNDFRAANVRAGYVYIISNRGSFGEGVVKIGLTRRLEPIDRVNELSGASVPFRFDVHGLFFSEDAVTLESDLHHHFAARRVNHANSRKEFFFATPSEVRHVLNSKLGSCQATPSLTSYGDTYLYEGVGAPKCP
ncbi:MAG: DUF4041 domain-containing protein [Polyangiaceae bacterium]|nr:DUF4041 domain-containing protein [Polyangiaceae bacterium]